MAAVVELRLPATLKSTCNTKGTVLGSGLHGLNQDFAWAYIVWSPGLDLERLARGRVVCQAASGKHVSAVGRLDPIMFPLTLAEQVG